MLTLIGFGCGTPSTVTLEGRSALLEADCILGAARLLPGLPDGCTDVRVPAVRPAEILRELSARRPERPCVVFSGDTGFYSGVRQLLPLLREHGVRYRILPGVSSVQVLSARLGRPWQDWNLISAHGTDCNPVSAVMQGRPAFFLTGGRLGPAELCRSWTAAGLGDLRIAVGENLSYEEERIRTGTAEELAEGEFAPLAVVLAEPAAGPGCRRTPGIEDAAFVRGQVPMTKQEARAVILAKLAVRPADVIWDVGAGTGSVSVELALAAPRGETYAIESLPEACALIRHNRERFGAWNMTVVPGMAPEALRGLPAPDVVFVGGSRGRMEDILEAVWAVNPDARICVSAIALETLGRAAAALAEHGLETDIVQVGITRLQREKSLHLMKANNPIFLVSGRRREGERT